MSNLLTVTDQMDREVTISFPPKRIVSLVPSQTEFLLDIGAPVVGRTKFCVHPRKQLENIEIIGGTKNFRFTKIKELNPDLIIGNKEENYQEGIEKLAKNFSVWMSDINTLEDSFNMMRQLGKLCDCEQNAEEMVSLCKSSMERVKGKYSGKVVYLIWKNPWMAAGNNTFIDHLLTFLGYENLVLADRYPELTTEEILDLDPDHILLSSEPFPFKEKELVLANNQWPKANCQLVDGELYSWYGSRLKNWS